MAWHPEDDANQREMTLDALRRHAEGLTLREMMDLGIGNPQGRIEELKRAGWDITSDRVPGARHHVYTLRGRATRVEILAGVIIRHDSRDGWTSRTHQEARRRGTVPEDVLARAERAAVQAYREIVDAYLQPEKEQAIDFFAWLDEVE